MLWRLFLAATAVASVIDVVVGVGLYRDFDSTIAHIRQLINLIS